LRAFTEGGIGHRFTPLARKRLSVHQIDELKIICLRLKAGCAMTVAAVAAIIAPAIDEVIAAHAALGAKRLLVQALTNRVVELRRQCAALGWRLARDGRQSGGGGSVCRRRRRRGARSFDRAYLSECSLLCHGRGSLPRPSHRGPAVSPRLLLTRLTLWTKPLFAPARRSSRRFSSSNLEPRSHIELHGAVV
jgi:hypothetical protein